ncbi:MAG: hypothetical protein K940chlam5_00912 [Candidatus Anoxychlamydiales bacterium]|nr:hypothetical protein [Candidatus Anoxychlamydiales bacterium]
MTKFAFLIAASANYIPGLNALFNSLADHNHKEDIILIDFNLPQDFLDTLKHLPFSVRLVKIKGEKDQVRGTAIERFRVAVELGKEYEAICLLDADMFVVSNSQLFFEIASKGFIVTGSNGMIINFNKAYQEQYQTFLGKDEWPYAKIHTSCPIFISPQDLDWFDTLYKARQISTWDDFLYLNILGIKLGKDKKMLVMPPYCFTGIHHFGVKPETGWFEKAGLILSGTEEQAYMIHGKWWDKGWRDDLPRTMARFFKDEGMSGKSIEKSERSTALAYKLFTKYSRTIGS